MVYHYLIAYSYRGGHGRVVLSTEKEITHLEDLERIESNIGSSSGKKIVITNYQLMRTENEPQAVTQTATA